MASARFCASAITRARAPESCGWATDAPELDGRARMAVVATASTRCGSMPRPATRGPTVLSGMVRRAWRRCEGSTDGFPWANACRVAAVTASRLIVVRLVSITCLAEVELL